MVAKVRQRCESKINRLGLPMFSIACAATKASSTIGTAQRRKNVSGFDVWATDPPHASGARQYDRAIRQLEDVLNDVTSFFRVSLELE
jgi:hypothetical protein